MAFRDTSEFRRVHDQKVAEKPKLFELEPPELPASEKQILDLENSLGVYLPASYRSFLKEFGGGSFGLTNIFSANPEGEYYSLKQNVDAKNSIPKGYLAFSDDFCGGWYVLPVFNGVADEAVFYWNADGGLRKTDFANCLEFLTKFAYDGI